MRSLGRRDVPLGRVLLLSLMALVLFAPAGARAAGPEVGATWVVNVDADSVSLRAQVNPGGVATTYHFDYIAEAGYQANLQAGRDGFFGASKVPPNAEAKVPGSGSSFVSVGQALAGLAPETAYRYRVFATHAAESTLGTERIFATRGPVGPLMLLDGRGWELVSPVDKNAGEITGAGGEAGDGVNQAALQGGAATFSSASSFGAGGEGAPVASQYVARRAAAGWAVENVTAPLFSGGYEGLNGTPYRLFAADLSQGLLAAALYPPLPGTGAPPGYENYYLRGAGGGFTALLTHADVAALAMPSQSFELDFAGASPDLRQLVLSTCAALDPGAAEVPGPGAGCDPGSPNLYQWSAAGLRLLSLRPDGSAAPGRLAAPSGAISADGARVFWTDGADLYLREGTDTVQVDAAAPGGGGGAFEAAAADGAVAFFSKAGHLYRYEVASAATEDLTPAGGVQGVLGASADGSHVYFLTGSGLFLNRGGANTEVAAAADAVNFPPSTGSARVSADGSHLAFVSSAELTIYDNTDLDSKEPHSEVYVYDAGDGSLSCASCRPTGERPEGPSTLPGASVNGEGPGATRAYKPRALTAGGGRLFFDSADALVIHDTNNDWDVYEWEEDGVGSCRRAGGCLQLISDGRARGGASFVDASADGTDALFLTDGSLVPADPDAVDLYDARVDGGFPQPQQPPLCEEDFCQPLPSPPDDPTIGTMVPSTGNPAPRFTKAKKHRGKSRQKKKHRRGQQRGEERRAAARGDRR